MKKFVIALTCVAVVFSGISFSSSKAFAASKSAEISFKKDMPIKVLYNARQIPLDGVNAEIKNNTVFIPLRAVSDGLGANVNAVKKNITISKGTVTITLTIGSTTAAVGGKKVSFGTASYISNNRTMVPVRFISETFKETVQWDSLSQFVWIGSMDIPKIEDVTELENSDNYKKYFGGYEDRLVGYDGKRRDIRVLSESALPVIIDEVAYYRMDLAENQIKEKYVVWQSSFSANIGGSFYLLSDKEAVRRRYEQSVFRERLDKTHKNLYMPIVQSSYDQRAGHQNPESYSIKTPAYIGIANDDYLAVIKNPWRQ